MTKIIDQTISFFNTFIVKINVKSIKETYCLV